MPRRLRFAPPGYWLHLTQRGNDKQPLFTADGKVGAPESRGTGRHPRLIAKFSRLSHLSRLRCGEPQPHRIFTHLGQQKRRVPTGGSPTSFSGCSSPLPAPVRVSGASRRQAKLVTDKSPLRFRRWCLLARGSFIELGKPQSPGPLVEIILVEMGAGGAVASEFGEEGVLGGDDWHQFCIEGR